VTHDDDMLLVVATTAMCHLQRGKIPDPHLVVYFSGKKQPSDNPNMAVHAITALSVNSTAIFTARTAKRVIG